MKIRPQIFVDDQVRHFYVLDYFTIQKWDRFRDGLLETVPAEKINYKLL